MADHFGEEKPHLKPLPAGPFNAVLTLDRRVSRDGMVSIGGNLYSIPDGTCRRTVEVQTLPGEIHILENGRLVATHPVLEGRGQRRIAEGHRSSAPPTTPAAEPQPAAPPAATGATVVPRPLAFYDAVGRRLAAQGERP